MAIAQRITADNHRTTLVLSTEGRAGNPDGNIFFNVPANHLEIITREELAQVDLGSGPEDNPMTNALGIESRALYNFERFIRKNDEVLRGVLPFLRGSYRYAGAYELVNGFGLAESDYAKVRGSGLVKRAQGNAIDRIYLGVRSLNPLDPGSQPFYQLAASTNASDRQSAVPVNFSRLGPVDEMVQVFGSTANGDTNAGDFDNTTSILITSVRTFGNNFGSTTSINSGIAELNGFSAGFGFGETPNASNSYAIADVIGGAAIAPWSTMTYEHFTTPQSKTGFVSGSADFDDVVSNPNDASLQEVRAFLDALMLQDTDQDAGDGTFLPKRAEPLYTIDPTNGTLITRQGLFLDRIPEADRRSLILTDRAGVQQRYPSNADIRVTCDQFWLADPEGWFHAFFIDGPGGNDFNTLDAITFTNASGGEVKGVSSDAINGEIRFTAAESDIGKFIMFLAEGNGVAAAGRVEIEITSDPIVRASVVSGQENFI